MQALILAGGKGTRLRPLTVYTPKPVVPVVNRPFLLYQIDILKAADVTDITLSLSYQPDKIEHILGNGSDFGINLRYITEPSPLGTGGAYRFAAESLGGTTIVFNGDILTNVDVQALIDFHRSKNAAATLAIVPVGDVSRYGVIEVDEGGRIRRFVEKPGEEELSSLTANTVNAGIYILEPEVLDLIPPDTTRSFEYEVFPDLLERGLPFFGFNIADSYWRDIGTPENYLAAHHDFLAGRIKGFDFESNAATDIATRAEVDKTSVIGEGCTIKPGVRVINSVIGPGVYLDDRAVVEESVIWAHTRVSAAAHIKSSVIGRSCHIGRNVLINAGAVIGDKSTLTDHTRV
jgi:mannose-1-phosphate guanylyltransferase